MRIVFAMLLLLAVGGCATAVNTGYVSRMNSMVGLDEKSLIIQMGVPIARCELLDPNAVRAVGSACATNPLPLFIPCHRVLRSDGAVGGYRGGADAKRFLLALEGIDV